MAKLSEYGSLDYDQITDYNNDKAVYDVILGLQGFPIVEESVINDGIIVSVFEKSFWSKKPKGYMILRIIEDAELDTTKGGLEESIARIVEFYNNYYSKEEIDKLLTKKLIGFEFSSEYDSYYVASIPLHYELGPPRKIIVSLFLLTYHLNVKYINVSKLHLQTMQSSGISSPDAQFLQKQCDNILMAKSKLKMFSKY